MGVVGVVPPHYSRVAVGERVEQASIETLLRTKFRNRDSHQLLDLRVVAFFEFPAVFQAPDD
jgi:hypothetical protein